MHLGKYLFLNSESWLLFAGEGCLCCCFWFGVFCFVLCLRKVSLYFPNGSGIPHSPVSVLRQGAGNTGCAHITRNSNELILKFLKVLGLRLQCLSRHRLEAWNSSESLTQGPFVPVSCCPVCLRLLLCSSTCVLQRAVSSRSMLSQLFLPRLCLSCCCVLLDCLVKRMWDYFPSL